MALDLPAAEAGSAARIAVKPAATIEDCRRNSRRVGLLVMVDISENEKVIPFAELSRL